MPAEGVTQTGFNSFSLFRGLVTALLVIFCLLVVFSNFTDTYTASNGSKFIVILMPFYGPLCFSLPTDFDKDRVYEFFYLKVSCSYESVTQIISNMQHNLCRSVTTLEPWPQ